MTKLETPLVSIIINCYNGEKYLREALDSVLTQTYQNWELIFWDNQSVDKSAEIFKNYSDLRFKYFFAPKHTLLSEARNCAIEYSTGEFLAFLDVDDWWAPEKLEKQIPLFDDQEVGLVYANYWYVLNAKNIKSDEKNVENSKTGRQSKPGEEEAIKSKTCKKSKPDGEDARKNNK